MADDSASDTDSGSDTDSDSGGSPGRPGTGLETGAEQAQRHHAGGAEKAGSARAIGPAGTAPLAARDAAPAEAVIVTGLPGAGRTTLVRRVLDSLPPGANAAVCAHRFKEGLAVAPSQPLGEHAAVRGGYFEARDYGSGSACCAAAGELTRHLRSLAAAQSAGPAVTHLLVETGGLADPAHFARLFADAEISAAFRLRGVVTVVSARNRAHLQPDNAMQPRALAQLSAADAVLVCQAGGGDAGAVAAEARRHCPAGTPLLLQQPGWEELRAQLPASRPAPESNGAPRRLSSIELNRNFQEIVQATRRTVQQLGMRLDSLGDVPAVPAPQPKRSVSFDLELGNGGAAPPRKAVEPLQIVVPEPAAEGEEAPVTPLKDGDSADGGDHEREAEEARLAAEAGLLPEPETVLLWLEERQEEHDDETMTRQGQQAVEWLVNALLSAWCSPKLKQAGRRLLAKRKFTANLGFMHLWHERPGEHYGERTVLMTPIKRKLEELGHELEDDYEAQNLRERVGNVWLELHPLVREAGGARQGLIVPAPEPGWNGRPAHRREFAYLHVLLMLAGAVNAAFHDWCSATLGNKIKELQTPPIKSYGRMRNKMFSADDHRFRAPPRPESNVDINRVLAVAKDPEAMAAAAHALSERSGGVAKQKNSFSLDSSWSADHLRKLLEQKNLNSTGSREELLARVKAADNCHPEQLPDGDDDAANSFHLRLLMLSVVFQMPADGGGVMTYAQLAADPRVVKMWDDYAKKPPEAGEAGCEWDADVAAARAFLCSDIVAEQPVRIIAEIQMVLPKTCEIRHHMHELYKVARADTDKQLFLDFKPIADKDHRTKQAAFDSETPLRQACRDGDLAAVSEQLSQLSGAGSVEEINVAFAVASRHGQVEVITMAAMSRPMAEIGWKVADEVIHKCPRPSLRVLETLFAGGVGLNSHDSEQAGHTLLHTACREGHTDVVSALIARGAELNVRRERDGCTALYIASDRGHTSIVHELLAAKADHSLHEKNNDASPLYKASENGHLWVVQLLIEAGANTAHESKDRTPMLIAANNQHKDVVEALRKVSTRSATPKDSAADKPRPRMSTKERKSGSSRRNQMKRVAQKKKGALCATRACDAPLLTRGAFAQPRRIRVT